MTAAEIFEVVKDVPVEAWPVSDNGEWKLVWEEGAIVASFWWRSIDDKTHSSTETNPAILFIGSMTRWLTACNGERHAVEVETWEHPVFDVCVAIRDRSPHVRVSGGYPSILHALAAACKAVKETA